MIKGSGARSLTRAIELLKEVEEFEKD
jgi:hypothetical protein